ncbi:hypothetical protein, partial [Corallococcus sp. CA054B]|uniref:hypothetical protein n=1 Tax=Corallococcus sp. CA054B TaxID=2316734 RepID=UPI00351A3098
MPRIVAPVTVRSVSSGPVVKDAMSADGVNGWDTRMSVVRRRKTLSPLNIIESKRYGWYTATPLD